MVLKPGAENRAKAIFDKWALDFSVIGRITDTGRLVIKQDGTVAADIPVPILVDDAPEYERPWTPTPAAAAVAAPSDTVDPIAALKTLMACPDVASRRWIWEQYDHLIRGDTLVRPGGDAGVVRVLGGTKALAVSTDCTPRYCAADPGAGGAQAVAECWRNLTATGARPLAITDCLNFGNPERPEIMGQFVGCIEGMGDACRALDFPVVSGNVSLYNETNGKAILPTPAVGGVGLIENIDRIATIGVKRQGDVILLLGG